MLNVKQMAQTWIVVIEHAELQNCWVFLLAISIVVSHRQSHRYGGMLGNSSAGSCVLHQSNPTALPQLKLSALLMQRI
jgi:hypothetical protein